MTLKDFIQQIRHTKIEGVRTTIVGDSGQLGFKKFLIESFDGTKIEKQSFSRIEDIPENLLQATFVKLNIELHNRSDGNDLSTFEFMVNI